MQHNIIREFATVNNGMLQIDLPDRFNHREVEVLIIARDDMDDLSHYDLEIKRGFDSSVSSKTHDEIFDALELKYEAQI